MSDIDALVALTVGVVRSRRWWQGVHHICGREAFVGCANAADNNPAWRAVNGHAGVTTSAPLTGEDDDDNA
jgi:hypothetical protein